MAKPKIFVFGSKGHAKVVTDVIERQATYDIACIVDDDLNLKPAVYGYPTANRRELIHKKRTDDVRQGIVAIGDNKNRREVARWLESNGFDFITAVDPAAVIGRGVSIGKGTLVMPGAVINADTIIGEHCIVNTSASIDHDCTLGSFVHVAPGAHLCGTVSVGSASFICAGVTIIPHRTIGSDVIAGAGSTVLDDVPDGVTVVGSPAKMLARGRK